MRYGILLLVIIRFPSKKQVVFVTFLYLYNKAPKVQAHRLGLVHAHAAVHAATGQAGGGSAYRQQALRCQNHGSNADRVLQSKASNLGRVNNTDLDHIHIYLFKASKPKLAFLAVLIFSRTIGASMPSWPQSASGSSRLITARTPVLSSPSVAFISFSIAGMALT